MPRLFDIRDVSTVQRLQAHARPLATHLVVVGGVSPLPQAMRSYLGGILDNSLCLVARDDAADIDAFALMQVLPDESGTDVARQRGAAMILISPQASTEAHVATWIALAQDCASHAGERGAHHIIADVTEGGLEASILQAAGFVPMIQQDLMKLARSTDAPRSVDAVEGLRLATRADDPLIRALHIRCAPRMTYPVERSADALFDMLRTRRIWVLERNNEIIGFIGFWHGRRGRAMRCLFRPEAFSLARDSIAYALAHSEYKRATYCNIRHYQNWLTPIFEELGFAHLSSTTLMAKYTTARVHTPIWSMVPQLAAARVKQVTGLHNVRSNRKTPTI